MDRLVRQARCALVVCLPALLYLTEVVGGPGEQCEEWLVESASEGCDAVLDGDGALLEYVTFDEPVALETPECLCQGLLGYAFEVALELVEPARLLAQQRQDQLPPLVEELIEKFALRSHDEARNHLAFAGTRFR
jgi:hypothetical protein